jgi:1-deoxy-D-xylulose-5-phosphate reductoisomerase
MKKIAILGSTGSIGINALNVIEKNPERFKIVALAAGQNINLINKQIEKFKPKFVALKDKENAFKLGKILKKNKNIKILYGEEGLNEIASCDAADIVLSAIAGAAGLMPTLAAIEAGKDIALANKETMVIAGEVVTKRAKKRRIRILPVDSEHSAIFQCLAGQEKNNLKRIILTASGGPFLNYTKEQLTGVTLRQALRHPKWRMGKKITIDSASLMNKGLEVIEARWLFNLEYNNIDVLIHPQSIVHSMIEFVDGSVLAQMGIPDMRIPIAYALTYPERAKNDLPSLNLLEVGKLEFYKPDVKKFPCLGLAYNAGRLGGTNPAVLNAANEIAVDAYIKGKIKFIDIPKISEKVLAAHNSVKNPSVEEIIRADHWARNKANQNIERIKTW